MNECVSVIIPVYNNCHLISRSIESVLNQTYQNFEIIVVDDASTEDIFREIQKFNDPRIRYFRHPYNKGAGAARNTGISASTGNLIAFQDSDDEWLADKLERQVKALISSPPDIGVVFGKMYNFNHDQMEKLPPDNLDGKISQDFKWMLVKNNYVNIHSLIKRDCFIKAGLFNEKMPALEDWDLWFRISKFYRFIYINEPLVNRFMQPKSITHDDEKRAESLEIMLRNYSVEMSVDPCLLASRYFEVGIFHLKKGDVNMGWTYYLQSIKHFPLYAMLIFPYLTALTYYSILSHNKFIWKTLQPWKRSR